MAEALLAATVRLVSATEALAALAAHVRVQTEALDVDPRLAALLGAVAAEVLGSPTIGAGDPGPQAVGMATAFLRESVALVADPGRLGDWDHTDEAVLQGLGRLSMAIAPVIAQVAPTLDGLAEALRLSGARVLDVGTGTGWLAIALARALPTAAIDGIDLFEPALRLARRNVEAEDLRGRITLRLLDVLALEDGDTYDAVWLPLPFLPAAVVPAAVARAGAALKPGGWLLPGTFAGPDDTLSRLLTDLRIVRSGGHPWSAEELIGMCRDAGLTEAMELPRRWPAPVRLWAARRPIAGSR